MFFIFYIAFKHANVRLFQILPKKKAKNFGFGFALYGFWSNFGLKKDVLMKFFLVFCAVLCCYNRAFSQSFSLQKIEGKRVEITSRLDANPATQAAIDFVAPFKVKVDSLMCPVLGRSSIFMNADRPESLLSNWAADVLLSESKRVGVKKRADFAVVNIGGLRNAMPQGDVTVGDIMEIAPFENKLVVLTLPGTKVLELFQQFAIFGGEGVSRGVELVYTAEGKLQSAKLNGKAIDPRRAYRIATLDYLAEGNDNMKAFRDCIAYQTSDVLVRDAYMDFIRQQAKKGKPLTSKIEGRIVILPSETEAKKPEAEIRQLLIAHTNDTHSCIYPINQNFSDTAQAGKAGYIRRYAFVTDLRKQHPDDMLLFDSGDFSQGSPYYNLFRGDVEVGLMNLMGYDAATIGNHEFDFGLENMARIFRMAKFPIVCCNYDFSGTPVAGTVTPYYILERGGLRIGVLGVCPPLEGLVATENFGATKYLDPVEEANRVAAMLRNEGQCDLLICLSHLGWNAANINDQVLIANTRNIDLVLGGHTHTYFTEPRYVNNLDGKPILCNQMGKNARYVGTLSLMLKREP